MFLAELFDYPFTHPGAVFSQIHDFSDYNENPLDPAMNSHAPLRSFLWRLKSAVDKLTDAYTEVHPASIKTGSTTRAPIPCKAKPPRSTRSHSHIPVDDNDRLGEKLDLQGVICDRSFEEARWEEHQATSEVAP